MTPSLASAHRYPNASRDQRYYNSQGFGGSSSLNQSICAPQQYSSQYHSTSEHRSPLPIHAQSQSQFIPTPSEIANSYNYNMTTPRSPTIQGEPYTTSALDYSSPPYMVSSSNGAHSHRPSRILTGRPRAGGSPGSSISPTSSTSPTGERFPCEKCGKTFSRSHDRKRHHETQHLPSPVIHRCVYCQKEFSRFALRVWPLFMLLTSSFL